MTHDGVLRGCFQGCPPHQEKARHRAAGWRGSPCPAAPRAASFASRRHGGAWPGDGAHAEGDSPCPGCSHHHPVLQVCLSSQVVFPAQLGSPLRRTNPSVPQDLIFLSRAATPRSPAEGTARPVGRLGSRAAPRCEPGGSSSAGTSSTGLGPPASTTTFISAYGPSYKVSSNNLQ